jgi:hypothetical protein
MVNQLGFQGRIVSRADDDRECCRLYILYLLLLASYTIGALRAMWKFLVTSSGKTP